MLIILVMFDDCFRVSFLSLFLVMCRRVPDLENGALAFVLERFWYSYHKLSLKGYLLLRRQDSPYFKKNGQLPLAFQILHRQEFPYLWLKGVAVAPLGLRFSRSGSPCIDKAF